MKWRALQRSEQGNDVVDAAAGPSPSRGRSTFPSITWPACKKRSSRVVTAHRHVVLDPMHGCWAERARRYLHAIFPQCFFSTIHDTVDAEFGGRTPDCSQPRRADRAVRRGVPRAGGSWASPSTATATASPWSTTKALP